MWRQQYQCQYFSFHIIVAMWCILTSSCGNHRFISDQVSGERLLNLSLSAVSSSFAPCSHFQTGHWGQPRTALTHTPPSEPALDSESPSFLWVMSYSSSARVHALWRDCIASVAYCTECFDWQGGERWVCDQDLGRCHVRRQYLCLDYKKCIKYECTVLRYKSVWEVVTHTHT